jgi:predicted aspartyl protease
MFCSRGRSLAQGCLSIFVAFLVVAPSLSDAKPSARRSRTTEFEALPLVRSRQNHLLVRAYINGKPAWLGVDSGAPVSAIALHRADYFQVNGIAGNPALPSHVEINGAFNKVGIVRKMRLGGIELADEPVVLVDLDGPAKSHRKRRHLREMEEQDIDGILGADILFPTKAVLDCRRRLLYLNGDPDSGDPIPGVNYRGFQSVPIQVSDGYNLYVAGAINDRPARLMVDTGSFATLLHRSFVRRLRIPMEETPFQSAAVNLKQRGISLAHIRKLSVGSVDLVGKDVGVVDLEGLIHGGLLQGSPPVAGLLGGELLNRHHGIIDFGTRTLYLKGEITTVAARDTASAPDLRRALPAAP